MSHFSLATDSETTPAALLADLRGSSLIARSLQDPLKTADWLRLEDSASCEELLQRLTDSHLLTPFQARRLAMGQRFGLVLGDYRVLDRLGSGGSSVVFRGEHQHSLRPVALKVLPNLQHSDQRVLDRFRQEIRIATRIRHPHIVRALGAGIERQRERSGPVLHYYAMEFVPGDDLDAEVRQNGPLPVARVVTIARQMAGALEEGHRRKLVHRDVKPRNIRLTPDGCAKLLDFGLAKWGRSALDEPGRPLGTIPYMAPEQVYFADRVDIRADLYGLGGTLYWCLTGQPPFLPRGSAVDQLAARLVQPAPSPRNLRPEVPPKLDELIQKMLALQPAERLATPGELIAALGQKQIDAIPQAVSP